MVDVTDILMMSKVHPRCHIYIDDINETLLVLKRYIHDATDVTDALIVSQIYYLGHRYVTNTFMINQKDDVTDTLMMSQIY